MSFEGALAAEPNPMQPPADRRPHAPEAETSVVSDCREAVTECKPVSEAIIPVSEREAIVAVAISEREAIVAVAIAERAVIAVAIAERRPIIPVADPGAIIPAADRATH